MSDTPAPPINLQREFGEPVSHDGVDDRWERALAHLARKRKTWRDLSAHTTVVLGEGGTGKTTELKARVAVLIAEGLPAFFIPIVDIVGRELRRALGIDAERLDEWLRGEQTAWFFLDGLDEGKLAGTTLRGLLRDLESQIAAGVGRAKLVLSCRPSEWEAKGDLAALQENARRWSSDRAAAAEVLVMLPLDLDRSMQLARYLEVQESEAFLAAIKDGGLELFLERPLDVEWFVSMWNETRRFGSLSQMIQENVRAKLTDRSRVPSARRLPADQAKVGARRLAAVATLSGQRAFPVREGVQRAAVGYSVAEILHEWSGEDVDGLLALPVFDEAVGGMVRLHSREVQEFLCAEWISAELRSGALSISQLSSLFFVQQGTRTVVPPHLVRVAAWLAPQEARIFDLLVQCAPQQLLDEGDPATLPIPNRERALRAFVERYRDRNFTEINFEPRGLRRFSDERLGSTISSTLAGATSEGVRVLLLNLIGFGRLNELADLALNIALDKNDSAHVRYFAVEAVALAGGDRHRAALRALLDEGADLDLEIAAQVIDYLFPSRVTVEEFRRLMLAVSPRGCGSTHTRLDSVLWGLEKSCPPHAQQEVLGILLDANDVSDGWLVSSIARLVAAAINVRPDQIDQEQTRRALALIDDAGSTNDGRPIREVARDNERVRHGLMRWHSEQLRGRGEAFSPWQLRSCELICGLDGVEDYRWLEQDAASRDDTELAAKARQVRESMERPDVSPPRVEEPEFDQDTREKIDQHLGQIRDGHQELLAFCVRPFARTGNGWGSIDDAALSGELAPPVVEAIRAGLSVFWRTTDVPVPRDWATQNTPPAAVLGLRALAWELADPSTAGTLSAQEALRATRYALWELNDFPAWLVPLRGYHPGVVDEEILLQAIHELRTGDVRERVLMKVFGMPAAMRAAITGRIEQLVLQETLPWAPAFESAVSLLLLADVTDVGRWRVVLDERFGTVANDEPFAAWWMLEVRADRASAITRLERLLGGDEHDIARVDAVIERIWKRIDDESGPFPYAGDAAFLERLYVILVSERLPQLTGVFDGRSRLRGVIETWIGKTHEGLAVFARFAERGEEPFRQRRDHFLRLAEQSLLAMPSMTPMSRTDAVNWTRAHEITAKDEMSLFQIVGARLENIATFLAHNRFSYRTMFHRGDGPVPERNFQLWLAAELANRSAGQYNVVREEEDAERKRPDITLHVTAMLPLSIEIKIADSWSYNDLVDALVTQLVQRYMHEVRSRVGILVVCVTHKTGWQKTDGTRVNLDQLLSDLRQLADQLVVGRAHGIERLSVALLDFRAPSTGLRAEKKDLDE